MRYSASEKYEIIRLVESSSLSVRQTLRRLDIHRSTFYNWLHRYQDNGIDGLEDRKPTPTIAWNQIPQDHRDAIIDLALDKNPSSHRVNWRCAIPTNRHTLSRSPRYIGC